MSEQRMYGREVVETRLAARRALRSLAAGTDPLALVALSGGADSVALALAVAHEAPRAGVRAGAIVVDHALQPASAQVAQVAAEQARAAGLAPVIVVRVRVDEGPGGPEAQAREARYAAFARAASEHGACAVLTAHTRSDQAEQVLLGLARGSGLRSLAGIPASRMIDGGTLMVRPFLVAPPAISRATTEAACVDQDVTFWRDPHNEELRFARVRARDHVLPMLEAELGPGIEAALVRTADLAREDADALDVLAAQLVRRIMGDPEQSGDTAAPVASRVAEGTHSEPVDTVSVAVAALAGEPSALMHRAIRVIARERFAAQLDRGHTLAIAALVTSWRGQATVYVPGIAVHRSAGQLVFTAQTGSPRNNTREFSRE